MITFSTKDWKSLTYLQAQGEQMLQLMGCMPYDAKTGLGAAAAKAEGIVQSDAVPAAMALLQRHSQQDQQMVAQPAVAKPASLAGLGMSKQLTEAELPVSLSTRTFPLLELLQAARQAGQPVIWRHSTCR